MNTLPFSQRPTESPRAAHPEDPMMDFPSEVPVRRARPDPRSSLRWVGGVLATAAVVAGGAWVVHARLSPEPTTGSVRIESEPSGAGVEIDGSLRGLTPLDVKLAPGQYAIVVTQEGRSQNIAATVTKGTQTIHHVQWSSAAVVAGDTDGTGRLQIISEPPGGAVSVDGVT